MGEIWNDYNVWETVVKEEGWDKNEPKDKIRMQTNNDERAKKKMEWMDKKKKNEDKRIREEKYREKWEEWMKIYGNIRKVNEGKKNEWKKMRNKKK